jgi:pimeloyl-ACP methyl ester carboxylesterase
MISHELENWQQSSQTVTLPNSGYKVFVKELGQQSASSDRTCLLVHGFPESSYSYHKIVDGLMQQFDRIVLFDMLGYGFSDKPTEYSYSLIEQADTALQVWRHLGVSGGHVICHDMGTSVTTELMARQVSEMLPNWFSDGFKSYTFTNGSMVLGMAKLRVMQKLLLGRFGEKVGKLSSYKSMRAAILSAHGISCSTPGALDERDIELLWENIAFQGGDKKNHLTIRYLHDRRRFEKSRWLAGLAATSGKTPVHFCWGDADQVARVYNAPSPL